MQQRENILRCAYCIIPIHRISSLSLERQRRQKDGAKLREKEALFTRCE